MDGISFRTTLVAATVAATLLVGCSDDDDMMPGNDDPAASSVSGFVSVPSERSVPETIGELETAINANENIGIVANIDHQANADSVGETLRPTSVLLFGNPRLGTPLMQASQTAGLDLPQKMLAWEDEAGDVQLGYNTADYLAARHGIEGADEALGTIGMALEALAGNASGATMEDTGAEGAEGSQSTDTTTMDAPATEAGEGIVTVVSTQDMDTTYNTLVSAIESAEPLRLVAQLDHADNAQGVGLELLPTRLVIFGNPNLGSPLMQSSQSIGVDLPQKMLVYQNAEGVVSIAYNDPAYLAARHGVTGQDERLATIRIALDGLANGAAGIGEEGS